MTPTNKIYAYWDSTTKSFWTFHEFGRNYKEHGNESPEYYRARMVEHATLALEYQVLAELADRRVGIPPDDDPANIAVLLADDIVRAAPPYPWSYVPPIDPRPGRIGPVV